MVEVMCAFLLGFAFGGAFFVVLEHEIDLSSHAGTLGVLLGVGLLLAVMLVLWFRRVSRNIYQAKGTIEYAIQKDWLSFLWGSSLLLLGYLTLVMVVAFL